MVFYSMNIVILSPIVGNHLSIRQWYVAFPLMSVGFYIAETPNSRCLFGKALTTTVQPTVIHFAAVDQLIFSQANKQQGI